MPGHLFISYARKDGAANSERFDRTLSAAGFATWRDTRGIDPSADFTVEIEKAIESATYVIACITPDVKREDSFVRRELAYALAVKIPILVARFANIVPPVSIVNNTYFDFIDDWDGPLARLQAYVSQDPQTRVAPVPALVPQDPFRAYLETLYKQIVLFLDKTVFKPGGVTASNVIPLQAELASNAVPPKASSTALPRAFFDLAGTDNEGLAPGTVFGTLADAFQRYECRLLLLGTPGSGKTTSAMAFARDAVAQRLDTPSSPLPVVLPVVTWDASQRPDMGTWIRGIVPSLADTIGSTLSKGHALLILDGLDELGDQLRNPQPEDVDTDPRSLFLRTIPDTNQVLLTSRLAEFGQIRRKAPLNGAVTLPPLEDHQIDAYLAAMPELRSVLDAQPELRDALRVPLLLSLLAVGFSERDVNGAIDLSVGTVRDAIFDLFIRRRYEHESRKPNASMPFTLDEIYSQLGAVAARTTLYMSGGGWWQRALLEREQIRTRYGAEKGDALAEVLTRLNLLVPTDETRLRYLHPLLQDHLAFRIAMKLATSDIAKERTGAMVILGELRDPRSLTTVVQATRDHRQQVRWEATRALANLQDARAIPSLIAMLVDTSQPTWGDAYDQTPLAQTVAADGLVKLGVPALSALIISLEHENAQICGAAAECLGRLGNSDALPALRRCAARRKESETAAVGWEYTKVLTIVARAIERIEEVSTKPERK